MGECIARRFYDPDVTRPQEWLQIFPDSGPVEIEMLRQAAHGNFLRRPDQLQDRKLRRPQAGRRQQEVLPLLARGLLNKQATAVLGITEYTVQVLRGYIMRKMTADSLPWSSGWWKSSAPAAFERAIRAPVNGGERR